MGEGVRRTAIGGFIGLGVMLGYLLYGKVGAILGLVFTTILIITYMLKRK